MEESIYTQIIWVMECVKRYVNPTPFSRYFKIIRKYTMNFHLSIQPRGLSRSTRSEFRPTPDSRPIYIEEVRYRDHEGTESSQDCQRIMYAQILIKAITTSQHH